MQANSDLTRESATIMVERGTAQVDNGKQYATMHIRIHMYK